uniref:Uncharacterized protein n=1 Tax=Pyramimonas orientalis virus TaxID=455367 RepID=A0A7M3UP79_POV01|nr:hypothetical protein HWQ62_00417 [Pyramimonas orientalis virus]
MMVNFDAILHNPLLMTSICNQLNNADTIHISLMSKDNAFQTTLNHIISNKQEQFHKDRINHFGRTVLSQIQHTLEFLEPNRSQEKNVTRLLNEMFDYLYENKLFLEDESMIKCAHIIEKHLIGLLDITYYYINALHYLNLIFAIRVQAEQRDIDSLYNEGDDEDYIEFIIDTNGEKYYI